MGNTHAQKKKRARIILRNKDDIPKSRRDCLHVQCTNNIYSKKDLYKYLKKGKYNKKMYRKVMNCASNNYYCKPRLYNRVKAFEQNEIDYARKMKNPCNITALLTGPKGGKYYILNNKKIYCPKSPTTKTPQKKKKKQKRKK